MVFHCVFKCFLGAAEHAIAISRTFVLTIFWPIFGFPWVWYRSSSHQYEPRDTPYYHSNGSFQLLETREWLHIYLTPYCHPVLEGDFGESGGTYWAGWCVLDLMSWEVSFDSLSDRITVMLDIKYKSCTSHISGVPSLNFCNRICAHPLLVNLGGPT